MTVDEFVDDISSVSLPNVFNPYRDVCMFSDHPASPLLRRQNLKFFLNAILKHEVRSIWLGRDLGYRGGRRTGIALTDEFHLPALKTIFGVVGIVKTTADEEPIKERTATEVWKILAVIGEPIFLWNVFPFHPFDKGEPHSNRRHTTQEFDSCRDILTTVFDWLEPTTVVALGADAEAAVLSIGRKCDRVRHPSYGGQTDFTRGLCEIYSVRASSHATLPVR
jgi:hypothetical protein